MNVEGDGHLALRKTLNPSFRLGPVNEVVPHMAALAARCCDKWAGQGRVSGLLAAKEYTFLVRRLHSPCMYPWSPSSPKSRSAGHSRCQHCLCPSRLSALLRSLHLCCQHTSILSAHTAIHALSQWATCQLTCTAPTGGAGAHPGL